MYRGKKLPLLWVQEVVSQVETPTDRRGVTPFTAFRFVAPLSWSFCARVSSALQETGGAGKLRQRAHCFWVKPFPYTSCTSVQSKPIEGGHSGLKKAPRARLPARGCGVGSQPRGPGPTLGVGGSAPFPAAAGNCGPACCSGMLYLCPTTHHWRSQLYFLASPQSQIQHPDLFDGFAGLNPGSGNPTLVCLMFR